MCKDSKQEKPLVRLLGYLTPRKRDVMILVICFLLTAAAVFVQPLIIRQITDAGMVEQRFSIIVLFTLLLFFVTLIWQLIEIVFVSIYTKIYNNFSLALYQAVFTKLIDLPIGYYTEKNTSEIIGRVTRDVESAASITDRSFLMSITFLLYIISGMIGLAVINWKMAIVVLAVIPVKVVIILCFSKLKEKRYGLFIEAERDFVEWFGDALDGVKEIKLWNLYFDKLNVFSQKRFRVMRAQKDNELLDRINLSADGTLDILVTSALYLLSGYFICIDKLTIGSAFAFIAYSSNVINPIGAIIGLRYSIAQVLPSVVRLFAFLDLEDEHVMQGKGGQPCYQQCEIGKTPRIVFEHVKFSYDKKKPILKDINLNIDSGEKIAIIGDNGEGKTTLAYLLLGLYTPTCGQITISGKPLYEYGIHMFRQRVSVVSQNPYLFKGTVKYNIALAPNAELDVVMDVAKRSGTHEFIQSLDGGYEYDVGHNGSKLSAGQKQKIAVTRALYKKSDIIIMDEATANYDHNTENLLYDCLNTYFRHNTVIVITHNYSYLDNFDRIYRLKDGYISQVKGKGDIV